MGGRARMTSNPNENYKDCVKNPTAKFRGQDKNFPSLLSSQPFLRLFFSFSVGGHRFFRFACHFCLALSLCNLILVSFLVLAPKFGSGILHTVLVIFVRFACHFCSALSLCNLILKTKNNKKRKENAE